MKTTDFKTVKIGTKVWMAENLNINTFRNGDAIPEAKTVMEWVKAGKEKTAAWSYYNNDPKNGEKYGKLYNWHAVNDPRGLAPEGWHIPSYDEFGELEMEFYEGSEKNTFKALIVGGSSGFNSLLGGWLDEDGVFHDLEINAGYHCDVESAINIRSDWQVARMAGFASSGIGFSIRCLKD